MPPLPTITSTANPRLRHLVSLRRRRVREEEWRTLVEGREELMLALAAGVVPETVFVCEELMTTDPAAGATLVAELLATEVEVVRLGRGAFEKVCYREGPDGFLALVPAPGVALSDLPAPGQGLVLVCQSIEKPGNLGALLRTADAAGVVAVVAADPITDWGNPNVVRASKGTVFAVPVASGTSEEVRGWLRAHAVRTVATTPHTDMVHTAADLTGPIAVALGNEKHGLTPVLLAEAQVKVKIPMVGRANSLNVATAGAIVLYEAVRQRCMP